MTTRACGCPGNAAGTVIDEARHSAWHAEIAPLTCADAVTLEAERGWPSIPEWTYVDDQFAAARKQEAEREQVPT